MSVGLAIWAIGAVAVLLWHLLLVPGALKSFTLINMAFWMAVGWPIFAIALGLGFFLKWLVPDQKRSHD